MKEDRKINDIFRYTPVNYRSVKSDYQEKIRLTLRNYKNIVKHQYITASTTPSSLPAIRGTVCLAKAVQHPGVMNIINS